jgi:sarcosine/dimethylglycine N-methyltransferase
MIDNSIKQTSNPATTDLPPSLHNNTEALAENAGVSDEYYNNKLDMYAKVWGGTNDRMCWGYFEDPEQGLQDAGDRHIERMAATAQLTPDSRILDVGCGKGTTAIQLAKTYGCTVVGTDTVAQFIVVANEKAAREGSGEGTVRFLCGTLDSLADELEEGSFSHVWSNGVFCHIPDLLRAEALATCYRLLAPGGRLVIDDGTSKTQDKNEQLQRCVLDRLHLDRPWSHTEYEKHLKAIGFKLTTCEDITSHMERTYRVTSGIARGLGFHEVADEHAGTAECCARGDFSWAVFRGHKPQA